MTSRTVIPRFRLPLQGPAWRGLAPRNQHIIVRFASSSSTKGGGSGNSGSGSGSGKPIVLEKPLKFNPPSHGSRLKRNVTPRHYGPQLTPEEVAAQNQRFYPGVMAPEGTWSHWFWNSRLLHVFITMGTLFILGVLTFFMNYSTNSPFKDLLPPISDLWRQPVHFFNTWTRVIVMHEQEKALRAGEHRTAHQNDVAKRRYYMKMHGIETKDPITAVFGKGEPEKTDAQIEAEALGLEPPPAAEGAAESKPQRKKMFGLF
jgi:hypothetical protein